MPGTHNVSHHDSPRACVTESQPMPVLPIRKGRRTPAPARELHNNFCCSPSSPRTPPPASLGDAGENSDKDGHIVPQDHKALRTKTASSSFPAVLVVHREACGGPHLIHKSIRLKYSSFYYPVNYKNTYKQTHFVIGVGQHILLVISVCFCCTDVC